MFILGVSLAVLIGVTLGLLGGGGSILTLPILLYVFKLPPEEAITASLLVVGATSAASLVPHARAGRVRWRESIEWMAGEGGVTKFVEIGAGKQLAGMVKRNAPDAEALSLNEPADLEAFAKTVS